ncbi:MAG: outer membrane protein assembly factor BamE [Burkholderiaceae bacterium]|nr:outer membrane protein assembly factor BamE [Burkholderiaceae bacterium]
MRLCRHKGIHMNVLRPILSLLLAFSLTACVTFSSDNLRPGISERDVIAKLGQPAGRYPVADGQLLEYPQGPWGQTTHMVKIGPDGRLVSWEQVLTVEKFATVKVGVTTKADIQRMFGRPAETDWLPLRQLEVWSYRYKEGGVWDSLMHVHFDRAGVVREMQNGRDPMFDTNESSRHGRGGRGR